MTEAQLTTAYSRWLSSNYHGMTSAAYEFKIVKPPRKSLSFSSFQPHQLPSLLKVKHDGLYWKIPDLGSLNPFDAFFLKGNAYVGIFWYVPRKQKLLDMIDVDTFVAFRDTCDKKFINEEESRRIAEFSVNLAKNNKA